MIYIRLCGYCRCRVKRLPDLYRDEGRPRYHCHECDRDLDIEETTNDPMW